MASIDLFMICVVAFAAVFVLLAILALLMRIIVSLFPQRITESDPALVAAVSSTYHSLFPGTKVTRIEEIP